jgi:hypothetical protein
MNLREIEWGGLDWIWLRIGTSGGLEGSCEHGNEPLGSVANSCVAEGLAASQEGLSSMELVGYDV